MNRRFSSLTLSLLLASNFPTEAAQRLKPQGMRPMSVGGPLQHPPNVAPEWSRPKEKLGKTLTVRAHFDGLTGYGLLATGLLRELQQRGQKCQGIPMAAPWEPDWGKAAKIDPEVRPLLFESDGKQRRANDEGWEMLLASPHHAAETHPCVQLTMWESNRIPEESVAKLNQKQALIVPSEWGLLSMDAAGVRRPIAKVNLPISDCFRRYRPMPESGPFMFGLCCRRAHGGLRKGVVQAVECFQKAFQKREDVRLKLKFYPDCEDRDLEPFRKDKRIEIIREAYTEQQVADFLASLHCYISTSQAEGWGLVQCQAMGLGRPVIGARAHAQAEYLSEDRSWLAEYEWRDALEVNPANGYYTGLVAPLKDDSVIDRMRTAYDCQGDNRAKGVQAHYVAMKMTWDKFVGEVLAVLRKEGMPV